MKLKEIKLGIILICLTLFLGCGPLTKIHNSKVTKVYNKRYNDNFYFVRGLERERSFMTSVKYRGLLYSDKLKEERVMGLLPVSFESLAYITPYNGAVESLIWSNKLDNIMTEDARKFLGPLTILTNTTNGFFDEESVNSYLKELRLKKEVSFEEKASVYTTPVNVFVKDLESIDIEEYKKKTLDLANYMYHELNFRTSLQVYVRDEKFFTEYKRVKNAIVPPFRKEENIKKILKKIKQKQELSLDEKQQLLDVFYKNFRDERTYKRFIADSKRKEDIPVKSEYLGGYVDGEYVGRKE